MVEQRKETRLEEAHLPPAFKKLMIHHGADSFPCQAVDAGAHGIGLTADKAFHTKIFVGQKIKIDFGDFKIDAEVLNVYGDFGVKTFRFGIFLFKEHQLGPYQKLLGR